MHLRRGWGQLLPGSRHTARKWAAIVLALTVLGPMGCAGPAAERGGEGPTVLVSFYPLQFLAERIAGPEATVRSLTPPGAEPHDLELSPAQVAEISRADLVVYISGFQPSVDEAIAARTPEHVVDAATLTKLMPLATEGSEDPGSATTASASVADPHFWLDPTRMEPVASGIAAELAKIAPERDQEFGADRDRVVTELQELNQRFADGLATCKLRTIVVTHAAFGYLASRYGLKQLSVGGIDPDAEPSPARIRQVAAALEGTGVTTVFFESQASPDIAQTLASKAGLTAAVLDPLETDGPGDYLTRMDADLVTLRTALECS